MASLLRFLGVTDNRAPEDEAGDVLRPIAQKLDELPPDRARFFAAFAYLLARIAGADLKVQSLQSSSVGVHHREESIAE